MRTNRLDGERLTRVLRRAAVVFLSLFVLVLEGFAEEPAEPSLARRKAQALPRSATSADGFVEVLAADVPGDAMGYRLPLLRFTTQFLGELEHAYGLEMPRQAGRGLVIHALDGETNDVRVIARVVQREGHVLTRLWLPSPGYTSLDALRFEIAQAYFRGWIDRNRPEGATALADSLPAWFAFGAIGARTGDGAHAAIRAVLELQSEKQLPPFPKFVEELKLASPRDAAVAGFVVAWLKERRTFRAVLEQLAAGTKWKDLPFLELLTGVAGAAEQKQAFGLRMEKLSRAALTPGRASAWDLKNFRDQLTLDLAPFAGAKTIEQPVCTFRAAIARLAEEPTAVRQAALQKLRELPVYAVRRGPALAAACEAYSSFLVMLARGAGAEKLGPLLDAAEAKLKEVVEQPGESAPKAPKDENGKNDNR